MFTGPAGCPVLSRLLLCHCRGREVLRPLARLGALSKKRHQSIDEGTGLRQLAAMARVAESAMTDGPAQSLDLREPCREPVALVPPRKLILRALVEEDYRRRLGLPHAL